MSFFVKSCSLEVPARSVNALQFFFVSAIGRNSISSGA
jgi:hypothetical protein